MTRHDLDLFSLLSGLVLVAIALVALFGISLDVATWVWPTVLIGVGLAVLGTVVVSTSRSEDPTTDDASDAERAEAMAAARAEVDAADGSTTAGGPVAGHDTAD